MRAPRLDDPRVQPAPLATPTLQLRDGGGGGVALAALRASEQLAGLGERALREQDEAALLADDRATAEWIRARWATVSQRQGQQALGITAPTLQEFDGWVAERARAVPPRRQTAWQRAVGARRAAFAGSLTSHEADQADRLHAAETEAAADNALRDARTWSTQPLNRAVAQAAGEQAIRARAARSGWTDAIRDQALAAFRERFHTEVATSLAGAGLTADAVAYLEARSGEVDPARLAPYRQAADAERLQTAAAAQAAEIARLDRTDQLAALAAIDDVPLRDAVTARVAQLNAWQTAAAAERRRDARAAVYSRWRATGVLSYGAEAAALEPEDYEWFDAQQAQQAAQARARVAADPQARQQLELRETAAWGGFLRAVRERPEILTDSGYDIVREWGGRLADPDLRAALKMQQEALGEPARAPRSIVSDEVALLEAAEGIIVTPGEPERYWSDDERTAFRRFRDEYDDWRAQQPTPPTLQQRRLALSELALRARYRSGDYVVPLTVIPPATRERIRQWIVSEERTQRDQVSEDAIAARYTRWRAGDDPALTALLGPPSSRLAPIEVPGAAVEVRASAPPAAPMTAAERARLTAYFRDRYGRAPRSDAELAPGLPYLRATAP